MEAARERQLPPSYERDLVMLHTMKPHFDANKQGAQPLLQQTHSHRVLGTLPFLHDWSSWPC
jgi:hypothetical protein